MMYETSGDRSKELLVLKTVSKKWNCEVTTTPVAYHMDGCFTRDRKIKGFAEVKRRNVLKSAYPTLILALHKYIHLCQFRSYAPVFLIVEWKDGIFYLPIDGTPFPIVIAGRTDRGDSRDIEPCVDIPTELFKGPI